MGSPLSSGTKLGRYEIRSQLGAGGMGEVYLASDTKLQRSVALKILPAEVAVDRNRMNRFVQEAKAASALNHPNILTIYEIDQSDSLHFIASEFVDGETLRQRMKSVRLSVRDVLDIAIQVGSALSAAHDAGILHRDIKPENIMLRTDGLVKVVDFGLAKLTSQQESTSFDTEAPTSFRTNPGTVIGTAHYMSPEQARGLELDSRTDVFSLAVVMYEMLAGRLPFEGSKSVEVIASLLNERDAQPLGRYTTEIPTELERIISKALRKNRAERYQTIKDMVLDLKSLKEELDFERKLERSTPPKLEIAAVTGGPGSATSSELRARPAINDRSFFVGEKPVIAAIVLVVSVGAAYLYFIRSGVRTIDSIAVLPFINASGNSELEYLSDGMTDSLINSLSQLPNLSVKARSSVFHYKGTDVDPQKLAADLSVQAILNGRVVQRGDDLTLYLSLVDGRNGNQIWGEQYNRKLADLISLQTDIAREVSRKLQVRLSRADEQNVTKSYTANVEAYQLYLKGRYHRLKTGPSDVQASISYFEKAIALDPSYALAYVGIADAYSAPGIELRPAEVIPKAKAAAQKALEIDDSLAEAHSVLGWIILSSDWDWNAAENQLRRALELDPNSGESHQYYAHLLSNTGRHAEALAEIKRARELEPLNARINALEGQFLLHAGRTDEALDRLQKTFELDPNHPAAHGFAASAYIEKGMFAEAIAEARKGQTFPSGRRTSLVGYALAKSGKQTEARAVLEGLLKLSKERYVSPYNIALIYNGLGERDEALTWLERGYDQRDVRMMFLKVEPKWNNLRSDQRFQDLLRRVRLQ
jgi:eukaryotic-like serine/threonine-protein kinase